MTVSDRFWSKVRVTRDPGDCWPWLSILRGRPGESGYGRFGIGGRLNHRRVSAHRFAWEDIHGPIPEGLLVLHRCDNPPCVNPTHLFLGTHQDNMDDRGRKGRSARVAGIANGNSRLRDADVQEILRLRDCGLTLTGIASVFDVSFQTIHYITTGQTWRHVQRG